MRSTRRSPGIARSGELRAIFARSGIDTPRQARARELGRRRQRARCSSITAAPPAFAAAPRVALRRGRGDDPVRLHAGDGRRGRRSGSCSRRRATAAAARCDGSRVVRRAVPRHAGAAAALRPLLRARAVRSTSARSRRRSLGLGLNYAAYEAEVYRAGIQAVPRRPDSKRRSRSGCRTRLAAAARRSCRRRCGSRCPA